MSTLSLITINCFGVPLPSTTNRLLTLAQELNRSDASVVCLQEVQAHTYRELLVKACTAYPYSNYVPFVHAPRGGLLTLSRVPIEQTEFTLYSARDLWYTPAVADWILHKGVLHTHITVDGVPVVVLNTHLTANYSGDWSQKNRYARNELSQLQQLAELIAAIPSNAIVLVAGDFNIPRGSWLYDTFLRDSNMNDPLAGDVRSTYRPRTGIPSRYTQAIDFALWRAPDLPNLRVVSDIQFQDRVPLLNGRQGYLSDHYGLDLRLEWGD